VSSYIEIGQKQDSARGSFKANIFYIIYEADVTTNPHTTIIGLK